MEENTTNHSDSSYYNQGSDKPKVVTSASLSKLAVRSKLTVNANRLIIVLVGLPGRGKSFISRKLQAYFSWQCIPCKVFNVGKYRRDANAQHSNSEAEDEKKEKENLGACKANFFDPKNEAAKALREEVAMLALGDALDWLDSIEEDVRLGGNTSGSDMQRSFSASDSISWNENGMNSKIAIFDATNSTQSRRETILKECAKFEIEYSKPVGVVFIESLCDDQGLLEENYRMKISVSPDYQDMQVEEALADCRERVSKYEEAYETIDDDSVSYIKLFNLSSKILANQIYGRMSKAVVPALMAWHIGHRPIYLCRPGKTEEVARIGRLDSLGSKFRNALSDFFHSESMDFLRQQGNYTKYNTGTSMHGGRTSCIQNPGYFDRPMRTCPGKIMCSTMPRAVETASWDDLTLPMDVLSNLNPLDKGDYSGKELSEIKELDPMWYSMLERDPYNTRFPGGECYHDLINRLESCVIDMEQQVVPVLVVSHVSVIQVLLSYFRNTPIEKCTAIEVPMNTVIKICPVNGGGWAESQIPLLKYDKLHDSQPSMNSTGPIWTDFISSGES